MNPETDRLPPHNTESERALISCILLSGAQVLPECISVMGTDPKFFYDLRHQTIYETCCELAEDNIPIDLINVYERLSAWKKLEEVGGLGYLQELPDAAPTSANFKSYLDTVREKYLLRRLIIACTDAVSRVYNEGEGDVDGLIDQVERDILRVGQERIVADTPPIRQLVIEVIGEMEEARNRGGALTGLSTGYPDFDRITTGLQPGEMIVIAARPSIGKTSLAMNIAEYVACESQLPVGVFSLEMTARALTRRMICARARVNLRNANEGALTERDAEKITQASMKIGRAPLYVDDRSGLSVMQVRAKARRWYQQYGVKLFIIDYLQLMNAIGNKRKYENRQQEVSDMSSGVKAIAKELNVPVIVLSQLNRGIEKEKNRLPRLSDLRESGAIEQDADLAGFLYRPGTKSDDDDADEPSQFTDAMPVNLLIAKQRNGPAGVDVNFTFLRPYTRFESMARIAASEEPQRQQQFPT